MITKTSLSAATSTQTGNCCVAARHKWHRHSCLCAVAKARPRRLEGVTSLRSESFKPCHKFLIANLELEFKLSPIRINDLRFSNRKFFAIFYPEERRVQLAPLGSHPMFLVTSHSSLVTAFLIETPRLEIPPTPRKQRPALNF